MEANAGGGNFFSTQGGILSFNDMPLPGNQMAVIITDYLLENVFYADKYDANNPSPPTCFAFGRDEATMAPHKTVVDAGQAQNDTCRGCPMNEWASAETGRGKACRNTRRAGMISAGDLDPTTGRFSPYEADHFEATPEAFMKLPVTSVKGFTAFVKQLAGAMKRPPHGVFTRVRVVPDPKTQFKVLFEPLGAVPNDLMETVMRRHAQTAATIEVPYSLERDEAPAVPVRGGKGGGRPPVKGAVSQRPPVKGKAAKY